jgi:two-component system response regulator YesN
MSKKYKVLIVDDERISREGLAGFVKSLDFSVLAICKDGSDAIEFLMQNDVDIVITDIRMRNINGIELAKFIYNNKPFIKVIIISGYEEFEYAKAAVEYDVVNYLLKPVTLEKIKEVLENVKTVIDAEKEKESDMKKMNEFFYILLEHFFSDIKLGVLTKKSEIQQNLEKLGLDDKILGKNSCIINFDLPDLNEYVETKWKYGREELDRALKNILIEKNYISRVFHLGKTSSQIKILAVSLNNNKGFETEIKNHFEILCKSISETLGLNIVIENIKMFSDFFDACGDINIVNKSLVSKKESEIKSLIDEECKVIISKISISDTLGLNMLFENLCNELNEIPKEKVIDISKYLFNRVEESLSPIVSNYELDKKLINSIDNVDTLRAAGNKILNGIVKHIETYQLSPVKVNVERAKAYIEDNVNKDISLDELANLLCLNPSYFSRFFKQQTGETFKDYVIKAKMEKALYLLQNNELKIYEISDLLGYRNSKYFHRVFKKYFGHSPKEYQKREDEII